MNSIIKDIRFALRGLLKHPAFTAIAVMTLALGIGGSTSIFTVVDAALLRGLPYKSPDQLYHVWEQVPRQEFPKREFSYPDYQDYQQNNVFEGLAAYTGGGALLSGLGETENVAAPRVSANFFSVLGVDPILGRTFQAGEDQQGGPKVTVLTYGFWQRRFGGDPERHRPHAHDQWSRVTQSSVFCPQVFSSHSETTISGCRTNPRKTNSRAASCTARISSDG